MNEEHSLIDSALSGNSKALENLIAGVQKKIFNLSLRFLWDPMDAEDASQEILIKAVTHLDSFQKQSSFSTWVHRIAVNHLIEFKRKTAKLSRINFAIAGRELKKQESPPAEMDENEITETAAKVKTACTFGMLQCLKPESRMAFVLGTVFETDSDEGSEILGISPSAFRQRVSRARRKLEDFIFSRCSVVNPSAPCRCTGRITPGLRNSTLQPYLNLAEQLEEKGKNSELFFYEKEIRRTEKVMALYKRASQYPAPANIQNRIKKLFSDSSLYK